jgi:hypothetical protein
MTTPPVDPYNATPPSLADAPPTPPTPPGFATTAPGFGEAVPYTQPAYPQQYYGPDPRTKKNWMGIVALIASLSTIVTGFGCIVGIVFGHLGLNAAKKGEANNRGLSLAGLIIGYVLLAIGLVVAFIYVLVIIALINAETV